MYIWEAVLKRAVVVIVSAAESCNGKADPVDMGALVGTCLAAVKKEVLL